MAKRATRGRRRAGSTLTVLRRRAEQIMTHLRRVGMRQVRLIDQQIDTLTRQRKALLAEIGGAGQKTGRPQSYTPTPKGTYSRVDWNGVFAKLPKTSFQAIVVKRLVPNVAAGTVSLRLARWVKEKKLRRTGNRRTTRYHRS